MFSGSISAKNPRPPKLIPITGFSVNFTMCATERKVPSPPTEIRASLFSISHFSLRAKVALGGS